MKSEIVLSFRQSRPYVASSREAHLLNISPALSCVEIFSVFSSSISFSLRPKETARDGHLDPTTPANDSRNSVLGLREWFLGSTSFSWTWTSAPKQKQMEINSYINFINNHNLLCDAFISLAMALLSMLSSACTRCHQHGGSGLLPIHQTISSVFTLLQSRG